MFVRDPSLSPIQFMTLLHAFPWSRPGAAGSGGRPLRAERCGWRGQHDWTQQKPNSSQIDRSKTWRNDEFAPNAMPPLGDLFRPRLLSPRGLRKSHLARVVPPSCRIPSRVQSHFDRFRSPAMRRRTKAIMTIPNSRFLATRAKIPSVAARVDDVFQQSDLDFS